MVRFHLLSRTRQITESSCGACALHAVLSYWGKEVDEEELMRLLGTSAAVGTFPERIVQGVRSLGLKAEAREDLTLDELRKVTDAGHPVIALAQLWRSQSESPETPEEDWDCGHYIVVLGVDDESVYFQDPYLRMGKGFVPRREFERHWHQVMGGDHARHPKLMRLAIFIRGRKPTRAPAHRGASLPRLDFEKLGSLNLIITQFRGVLLPFDFMDRLRDIWGSKEVRPAAFVLVRKSVEGEISAMEGGSLEEGEDAAEISAVLAAITSRSIGGPRRARVAAAVEAAASGDFGISVPEIRGIANRLPPDHSTIILLFENTWERRLRAVVHEHGGEVLEQRLVPADQLTALARDLAPGSGIDRPYGGVR
jgi:predicted double-glycine peptidase